MTGIRTTWSNLTGESWCARQDNERVLHTGRRESSPPAPAASATGGQAGCAVERAREETPEYESLAELRTQDPLGRGDQQAALFLIALADCQLVGGDLFCRDLGVLIGVHGRIGQ